jgi:hypothetical protein
MTVDREHFAAWWSAIHITDQYTDNLRLEAPTGKRRANHGRLGAAGSAVVRRGCRS